MMMHQIFIATCDELILDNGTVSYNQDTRLAGTIASFSCDTGYRISSTDDVMCLSDRQWNGSTPVCYSKYDQTKLIRISSLWLL